MFEKSRESVSSEIIYIDDEPFEEMITYEQIQNRIQELGAQIEQDYAQKQPIFIGILNGAFVFLSDLIRTIESLELEIDFYKLSSYGNKKISSGQIRLLKSVDANLNGRDVIVVEDIIDTGLSIKYICDELRKHKPNSLRVCSLLYKEGLSELDFRVDYVGFRIPKQFVIGYGLDYKQMKRNLKSIYCLKDTGKTKN
jgi:hypoxanthine phosphoribosyltransferase